MNEIISVVDCLGMAVIDGVELGRRARMQMKTKIWFGALAAIRQFHWRRRLSRSPLRTLCWCMAPG